MHDKQLIKDVPSQLRPYEKCIRYGESFLSNEELLAIIIKTGTTGESSTELAKKILGLNNNDGDLLGLMHLSLSELMSVKGVGKVKAIQIKCVAELSKRISMSNAREQLDFSKPETIANYYMEQMRHLEVEQLFVLFLDTKCHLISEKVMFKGTVNSSLMSPREIFIEAFRLNAVNIILMHNHPSGDTTPSKKDVTGTIQLIKAGTMVGINVLDHIIIGDRSFISLKQNGSIGREHF
ncbi:MAG: DNA repair protein RadC [Lachnospiraceae bacterium]|nr:DNA repair protein RadC [Lachnospiraceae bacterium]